MFVRALIVVLITLNVGVFAWWMSQPAAPQPVVAEAASGIARLRLPGEPGSAPSSTPPSTDTAAQEQASAAQVQEVPPAPASSTDAAAAQATPAPAVAVDKTTQPQPTPPPPPPAAAETVVASPLRCASLGPFADAAAAEAGRAKLGGTVARAAVREVAGNNNANNAGYRVMLPAAADRAAAQANVQRIVAAGLNDYYLVNDGPEANAVALGRYRNIDGAQRRLATLQAAGFDARIVPVGEAAASQWWLDVAFDDKASAAKLRGQAGAARQQARDCSALR